MQRTAKICLAVILVLLIPSASYALLGPEVVRCYLVRFSSLTRVERSTYLDPAMSARARSVFRTDLASARERVAALYGELGAEPVLIISDSADVARRYGSATGSTHYTPLGNYVVIGPSGLNVDVIAHELSHAELRYRSRSEVPVWFDEGLAAMFDRRLDEEEAEWVTITDGGRQAPPLSALADRNGFIRAGMVPGYITARHEVARWLRAAGLAGFRELLAALSRGEPFEQVYRQIEQAHQAGA
jgi:hypothetical protein